MRILFALFLAACGGTNAPPPADMASAQPGLALPTCQPSTVTDQALWDGLLQPSCAFGGCHGTGGFSFTLRGPADVTALLGASQQSSWALGVKGSPERSYVVAKVLGQQARAGGSGTKMPPQGATTADQCLLINWLR